MKKKSAFLDYAIMTLGVLMLTSGVYFFRIPNGFTTGGVSGVATLLGKFFLTPGTWIAILNVFLLIVGFIFLGRETGIRTVYCSLLFSALSRILEIVLPMTSPLTDQPLLELVYATMLSSIGSAMIFYRAGSSGGTDIIALILKKFTSLDVGKALLCVDIVVVAGAFFVFDIRTGLFSVLGLFAKAFLVDSVIESFDVCKSMMIITTHPKPIEDYIMNTLHRSATIVEAKGAYSGDGKVIIYTVCKRIQARQLHKEIHRVDGGAFVVVNTSSEIIGRGFRGV